MKSTTLEQLNALRLMYCDEIENHFINGETIEFNQPFTIYVSEENTYDDSQVKVPYIVKSLSSGKHLIGTTHYGDEFDDLSIYDLEDIVYFAYLLDLILDKEYSIIQLKED